MSPFCIVDPVSLQFHDPNMMLESMQKKPKMVINDILSGRTTSPTQWAFPRLSGFTPNASRLASSLDGHTLAFLMDSLLGNDFMAVLC